MENIAFETMVSKQKEIEDLKRENKELKSKIQKVTKDLKDMVSWSDRLGSDEYHQISTTIKYLKHENKHISD